MKESGAHNKAIHGKFSWQIRRNLHKRLPKIKQNKEEVLRGRTIMKDV